MCSGHIYHNFSCCDDLSKLGKEYLNSLKCEVCTFFSIKLRKFWHTPRLSRTNRHKVIKSENSPVFWPTATGNSHATWDHTVLHATRQRWHSRPYPSRSWYSIKRLRRDARLSWPSINWNVCLYRGANLSCTTVDAPDRIATLKSEIALLEYKEKELDKHKMWVQQSIKNVTDDAGNHEYLLISCKKLMCLPVIIRSLTYLLAYRSRYLQVHWIASVMGVAGLLVMAHYIKSPTLSHSIDRASMPDHSWLYRLRWPQCGLMLRLCVTATHSAA